MATFGRLLDGKWLDVTTGPDLATVQLRFPYPITACPATDTNGHPLRHGATDNGNGTATNPSVPTPATVYATLSATSFMDIAIAGLVTTGLTAGAATARFQEIVEGAKNFAGATETALRVRYAHERYAKADKFNREVVSALLSLFASPGVSIATAQERTAILSAWPVQ